ncbi:MAG: rhodanese-like domain-containing protein [Nocardioides sp.]|nr:rhodanese-like domain-containing protein [Nocardioides sp.]
MSQTPDESQQPGYAGDVDPQQAWEMLQSDPETVMVDCRTEAEWTFVGTADLGGLGKEVAFVPWNYFQGGLNEAFVEQVREAGVREGQPIVFLCRSGTRSVGAAKLATEAGLGPAYNILEGFEGAVGESRHRDVDGWKVRGLPWRQG